MLTVVLKKLGDLEQEGAVVAIRWAYIKKDVYK